MRLQIGNKKMQVVKRNGLIYPNECACKRAPAASPAPSPRAVTVTLRLKGTATLRDSESCAQG